MKLLIISDSPGGSTGLGRITRELAQRIQIHLGDKIQVATLGMGGQHSSRLNWPQYQVRHLGPKHELLDLPEVLRDFAGGERCILFFIWNPGWLEWMADPEKIEDEALRSVVTSKQFEHWIYAPIDAEGPHGLPEEIVKVLAACDRRLFYTEWSAVLYGEAVGDQTVEYLPHGIDGNVFYPRDRKIARDSFVQRIGRLDPAPLKDGVMLVGVVATNTARKDWPLAFEIVAELVKQGVDAALWAHTSEFYREYDFHNLTIAFGLNGRVIPTKHYLSSDALAWAYSACDITLGIGSGEGFGYPLAESLSCGVHALHGHYAGGTEVVLPVDMIEPIAWRHEGLYCHRRPVFDAKEWADRAMGLRGLPPVPQTKFHWKNLWPSWEEWLLRGIEK